MAALPSAAANSNPTAAAADNNPLTNGIMDVPRSCVCHAAAVRVDATLRQSACDMVAGESSFPLGSRRQLKVSHWTIAGGFPLAAEAMLPYPSQEWSEHMPS